MVKTRLYLTASLSYDRAAIMRSAWGQAHTKVKNLGKGHPAFRRTTTARAEFGQCLGEVWAYAKSERSLAIWSAEQDANAAAEGTRFATLTPREREIEVAQHALMLAEHSDATNSHRVIAECRDHLMALRRPQTPMHAAS